MSRRKCQNFLPAGGMIIVISIERGLYTLTSEVEREAVRAKCALFRGKKDPYALMRGGVPRSPTLNKDKINRRL
jgi:hypothetical protein